MVDDIGGIVAAAKPDFEQQVVRLDFRKEQKRRRRGQLEIGDRQTLIDRLATLKRPVEPPRRNELSGKPDSFAEMHQMR